MSRHEEKLSKLVDLMEESPRLKSAADGDLRELLSLREALKRTDMAAKARPFNKSLHDRILAEIESEVPQSRWSVKFLRPQILVPFAAAVVGVLTVGILSLQPVADRPLAAIDSPIVVTEETPVNQMLLSVATKDPSAAAEAVNAPGSEQDFALDALATQLDGLSGEQVDSVFESLMEE